jgi:hypothetical protein
VNKLQVPAAYGDQTKMLTITTATGGADGYMILIDNYFQGMVLRFESRWVGHLNESSELTGADIMVIGEIIEDKFGN